jgi:hypothetical protein
MILATDIEWVRTHEDIRDLATSEAFRLGWCAVVSKIEGENAGNLRFFSRSGNMPVTAIQAHVYTLPVRARAMRDLVVNVIKNNGYLKPTS